MTASTAWRALSAAMDAAAPACRADGRFTEDFESAEVDAELRKLCRACPIERPCDAYARAERSHRIQGVWAGRRRGTRAEQTGTNPADG